MKDHITKDIKKSAPQHFNMKILRDGTWLHDGSPIKRLPLVKLFSTVLKCDDQGQHWLETPVEKGMIDVEDSAFVSKDLKITGLDANQQIEIVTNIDQTFEINAEHPIILSGDVPYVALDKNLRARIVRSHYYELAKISMADPKDDQWQGFWSGGIFHRLGRASV